MHLAIQLRARIVPALEHRDDGRLELLVRVGRELSIAGVDDDTLVRGNDVAELRNAEHRIRNQPGEHLGVVRQREAALTGDGAASFVERRVEQGTIDPEHDVTEHGEQPSVGVERKPLGLTLPGQDQDGLVVQPKIQHGVHHSGHRAARARSHADEERIRRASELLTGAALQPFDVLS